MKNEHYTPKHLKKVLDELDIQQKKIENIAQSRAKKPKSLIARIFGRFF